MQSVQDVSLLSLDEVEAKTIDDEVVVEEPLEIRVNGVSLGITMRTPGDDFDLARGFLWTEGLVQTPEEIGTIAYCPDEERPDLMNVVNVQLTDRNRQIAQIRNTWMNSSCGICGKTTVEAIRKGTRPVRSTLAVDRGALNEMPERLRAQQQLFSRTGGIHAAGLFDFRAALLAIREDIGRHNAVDKVLGAAWDKGIPTNEAILMVSGRLGFEILQKAVAAGIPIVASVSAPSSLAISLAAELGVTAIGFVRGSSMNIYTHPYRVTYGPSQPAS
jgi:FdhD protein